MTSDPDQIPAFLYDLDKGAPSRWQTITSAHQSCLRKIRELEQLLQPIAEEFPSTSVVAFGSLARHEWTSGSDVDWAIIHDGKYDHRLRNLPQKVAKTFSDADIEPPSEISEFGKLCSSFELASLVGSKSDQRLALSRRMLLLFESAALSGCDAHQHIIVSVLEAYRSEETLSAHSLFHVPRYLLNDLNQFWRLMCTDYAGQTRAKEGKHWGLRSIKLNFSRKLLYVAGAIRCVGCHLDQGDNKATPWSNLEGIYNSIRQSLDQGPLETICKALEKDRALKVLDSYEAFLSALDCPETRTKLAELRYEDSENRSEASLKHRELWEASRMFHDDIVEALLNSPELGPLTRGCLIL